MQQDPDDPTHLEALVEIIQNDVKALEAGDPAARTRLVGRSAQLQRAVETPAERTFKMRFAAGFSLTSNYDSICLFLTSELCSKKGTYLYIVVPPTIRTTYLH